MLVLLAIACSSGAPEIPGEAPLGEEAPLARSEPAEAACPPGMVLVSGSGEIGMKGQPYGIVETAHLAVVDAPERGCPDAIAHTPGAVTCWVQTDQTDPVLAPRPVALEPYCIDAFPFPGEGAAYTSDGMTAWDAERLAELLATGRYGARRLCTFTELQAAVAGLRDNRRFVFGDGAPGEDACPEDGAIGADPGCASAETGVRDYGAVMSHWVVADADFVEHACAAPPCAAAGGRPLRTGGLVVAGGTRRAQTRQAPLTPHTWHDHGEPNPDGCDAMGHDDQPVICADPDPRYATLQATGLARQEAAWASLVDVARSTGQVTAFLEAGLGRPVCPPASATPQDDVIVDP